MKLLNQFFFAIILLAAVSACGQKGPLELLPKSAEELQKDQTAEVLNDAGEAIEKHKT